MSGSIDKKGQMLRMFDILEEVRLDGKHRKHRGEKGARRERAPVEQKEKCVGEDGQIRIHPSAKNLLCILLQEESLNQRNIATMMNITAQAVSEIVKKMLERGFIHKESGEINNENIITLTESGREVAEALQIQRQEYAEKLFWDFTEEELQNLHDLMEKIYDNRKKLSENSI